MRDHLYHINNKYALPDYRALSDYIINNCYETIYSKIEMRLKAVRWLNFYTNKSNNIRKERVINFLAHASPGYDIDEEYFYINSKTNESKTINAAT